jgi:dihydrofolate synthase / folylpolyglutamate synthase
VDYLRTLEYLYSQLPMFHRIGQAAYKANLDNTIAICNLLQNPQHHFRSVHIAGTNGKGSTSHYLASILQSKGLKTGLYTSPHLKDFRERIKINGAMIPEKNVVAFVEKYKEDFEKIKPSFFEMTVGLAFDYFKKEKVDIAVIETGLGGRLDSTNIITPLLSVITNIGLDHQALLGDSVEKIAVEKAGIIKKNIPVVIGESNFKTKNIFVEKAKEMGAPLLFADELFSERNVSYQPEKEPSLSADFYLKDELAYKNLVSELGGLYQVKNIKTVLTAVHTLNHQNFSISETGVREGLRKVVKQTGLMGRWQVLSRWPFVVADTGHNEDGIKEVLAQVRKTPHRHLHFVLGMVNDKDIGAVLRYLPTSATYYFCKANIPRALDEYELKQKAAAFHLQGLCYSSVKQAFEEAKLAADKNDMVLVGGSTFVVAEIV